MKIYVASSWRNAWQPAVVRELRRLGHDVFDFREQQAEERFSWRAIGGDWTQWSGADYRQAFADPRTARSYHRDMAGLRAADACVLVAPCGCSAHFELGFAFGAGKACALLLPVGLADERGNVLQTSIGLSEPELMTAGVDLLVDVNELAAWVAE